MTTQRDRLAAVLFGIRWGDDDNEVLTELRNDPDRVGDDPLTYAEEWFMTPLEFADALLVRGVRVVDEETLGEALKCHACEQEPSDWGAYDKCGVDCSRPILEALDDEP